MKNFHIAEGRRIEFGADIIGDCLDLDNKVFYVLASDLSLFSVKTGASHATKIDYRLDTTKLRSSMLHRDDVILTEFIVENRSIVVVLKNGQVLQISLLSDEPHCDILYLHPTELSSVKYSPNQDLIALADCNNELIMMTPNFESLGSTNALEENNSAHKPVGVGWGSKETQFFGLDGRPSKEKQAKEQIKLDDSELKVIEEIESSPTFKEFRTSYQRSTVIDWRGDGHFLATITYIPDTSKHYLKVWNRNLELQYMSEQLVTVERGLISWVPNGQYVCLAQRREQRINEIALFEKNGLVHQRITLPFVDQNLYIQAMSWSTDSKILALLARRFDIQNGQVQCKYILFLYTMQNFYYYLKYTQYLEDSALNPRWDLVDSRLHLTLAGKSGYYMPLDCRFHVDHSEEFSTVFVVDANRVLITPMDLCNVPPPMSALELILPDMIRKVAVCPRRSKAIFVLTLDGKLFFHHPGLESLSDKEVELKMNLDSASDLKKLEDTRTMQLGELSHNLHHLTSVTLAGNFFLVAVFRTNDANQLILIDPVKNSNVTLHNLGDRHVISITQFLSREQDEQLAMLFDDGTVEFYDLSNREMITKQCLFTADVNRLCNGLIKSRVVEIKKAKHLITLNSESILRFDNRVISSSCNSFRTTEHYLLYTTTDNNVHLTLLGRLDSADNNMTDVGSWSQSIENGGTLITASEQSSRIVLQMPRGNLETLHLRIFIFTSLTNLLSMGNYVEAIKLARRHRVNLNFLCDYLIRLADGPFLISKFAAKIAEEDPALLNLFLTELEDSDTILGRYKNIMEHLPDSCAIPTLEDSPLKTDKVNKICSNILLTENPKYLQPRLLCLLTYKPAKTTEALKIIHDLPQDLKESCLRFVLYFVNIEQLFLESIRTYDTDIALMVAGASNKDPKEYLALLDGFNATENTNLRRHLMDLHVSNYESAFDNLLEYSNEIEDKSVEMKLVELVSSKRLYKYATSVLNKRLNLGDLTRTIWSRYADYLLEKKHYLEAGVAFSKALALSNNLEYLSNALKCFSLANEYENSLALIARSDVDGKLKAEYRHKISSQLFERGKNFDAIAVMCDIPKHVLDDRAFEMINHGDWYLAEYFSSDEARPRIHGANLMAILEHCDTNLQSVLDNYRFASNHFERLLNLLENHQDSKFNNPDFDNLADSLSTVDGSEVSSLAASAFNKGNTATRSGAPSLKTRTSSKSNRSQVANKKRINLKQGSRHEDLALILELQKFVSGLYGLQEQNLKTSAALYTYCDLNLARERTESMNQTITECYNFAKKVVETLWPNSTQSEDKHSLYRRFNANALFSPEGHVDNVDLQVLMRPELPKSLTTFEL